MRLDLNTLDVQSFSTNAFGDTETETIVIEEPSIVVTKPIDPETHFYPCTRQLTCVGCA
ncbi:hypothetical protein [Longimicrobium sp.]|uniref:hypothetical protein n=1 Tax=Longimicrobium sp. TaxID=2029185 RepID=UPI002E375780|nr:hypothetical protein [Longimicrobium sp.]HEX6040334.1 hypothetical protein [Longimicrobium sp.]